MNKIDLTQPTRQSSRGLILIFLFSAQKFIRAFWPMLLVLVVQNKWFSNQLTLMISAIILLVLLIVHTILYYLNFYFYVSGNEFVLKKGYLKKKTLTISLDRIQSVNTKQNILQQFLNVVTLEIDTAGAVGKELKIHALDKSYSEALQEQLRTERKEPVFSEYAEQQKTRETKGEVLLKLSPADLLKIGISQNHIRAGLVIVAFGFQIFQQVQDLFNEKADEYSNVVVEYMSNSNWALITFLVIFFMVVAILFSLFRTIIKYFEFKLIKREDSYRIEAGLINKRNVIIPHHKVQELNWETGPLKKLFGIYHLVFKQAVSGQNRRQQQLVDAPGCLQHHLDLLMNDLFGEDKLSAVTKIYTDNYYFRRLWLFFGWLPAVLPVFFLYGEWMYWLGVVLWLLATAGYSYLILKKRYFRMNNDQIRISKGAVEHKWEQMKLYKIQAVEFHQTIFQKRRALASLRLMNASGTITIPFIDEKLARQIYDYVLYHTEISEERWM